MNTSIGSVSRSSVTPNFLSAVWGYFALSIGISTVGVFTAPIIFQFTGLSMGVMWGIFLVTLGLIFTSSRWSESPTWRIPLFVLFAFLMGVSTFPLIGFAVGSGHTDLVVKALVSSACLFAAAGIWGFTTQKDLSGWGGFLMMSLFGLITVGILQIFWFSNTVELISSGFAVIIFSGFAAYDIQNIKHGMYPNPLVAAMNLFLDMILLFQNLLSFMLSLGGND